MEQGGLNAKDKATKRITQLEKVLALLIERGPAGATSEELNKVCFRYSAVIHTLRHTHGHDIETKPRSRTELVRFIWWQGPQDGPTQLELMEWRP